MGIMSFLKKKAPESQQYADASSIEESEKPYYQPDSYYTLTAPGLTTEYPVKTFDERKAESFPSKNGLYVPEILLLEYCSQGKYPRPKSGYPGFWWFKYGIRDIGHALQSLEERGFLRWASPTESLRGLTVKELKQILTSNGLPASGKKDDLIESITSSVPEDSLPLSKDKRKYTLTPLGEAELTENGYVPYMHKHPQATIEDSSFGQTFTVWDINRLFANGNTDWKEVVGTEEKRLLGEDLVNSTISETPSFTSSDIRDYIQAESLAIEQGVASSGSGYDEQMKGIALKKAGRDNEALVQFYIAIGKQLDTPALYRETSILLRKYKLYDEEVIVLNDGIRNVPRSNEKHWNELNERLEKAKSLMKSNL